MKWKLRAEQAEYALPERGPAKDIPFELAGWSDMDLDVYRRGEDQAFLVSPCLAILRPWSWEGQPYRDDVPVITEKYEDALRTWDATKPTAYGHTTIGELLVWASARTARNQLARPLDDDGPMFFAERSSYDYQPIPFGGIVNRLLILEALHASIAQGCTAGRPITMRVLTNNGAPLLAIRSGLTESFVMSAPGADPGNNPMPGQWARATP